MKFSLLYLAEPKFGGWVTFSEHLYNCLAACGHEVSMFTVGARLKSTTTRFSGNVMAQQVPPDAVSELPGNLFVTAVDNKSAHIAKRLWKRKVCYDVHDPTELDAERLQSYAKAHHLLCHGPMMIDALARKSLKASILPHPYLPSNPSKPRDQHAVSFSRLDWDKHTDIICSANQMLPPQNRCQIYGAENRLYTYMSLCQKFPNWKSQYRGQFAKESGAGAKLAASFKWAVDMSAIKGEGGRTQYTFLEAWDAGCGLILNTKWIGSNNGEVKSGFNCIAVPDGPSLAAALSLDPPQEIIANGKLSLEKHGPKAIERIVVNAFA